jgi:hypothetical protein
MTRIIPLLPALLEQYAASCAGVAGEQLDRVLPVRSLQRRVQPT